MNTPTPAPDFKTFYQSLNSVDRDVFAALARTQRRYIETHLLYARRVPRKARMEALWHASRHFGNTMTYAQFVAFFLGEAP